MERQTKADLMLLVIAIFWGFSYLLTKVGLEGLEPFNLTALRFIIAFIISAIIFRKKLEINKGTIKHSFILGILLFSMFVTMAFGLEHTTASNAGFLISLAVVLIPIFSSIFLKDKIERRVIIGVILAFVGIALLSLDTELKINTGDLFCLLCAVVSAAHVIVVGIFTQESEPITLGVLQLGFAGLLSIIFSFFTETVRLPSTKTTWFSVLTLSIFCTAISYIVQTTAQQHTTATHTGLIFSTEPVFSAIFSYIFLNEVLEPRAYLGAFILMCGVLTAEVDFKKLIKKDEEEKFTVEG